MIDTVDRGISDCFFVHWSCELGIRDSTSTGQMMDLSHSETTRQRDSETNEGQDRTGQDRTG